MLRVRTGHVVVSTDVLVEGRHFRRDWASAADIGHRAAAANLSDVNAMGGRASSLTIGLAAPADLPVAWALEFAQGFAEEAALVGASVVGGDLTQADQVVIAVTVLGACTVVAGAALGCGGGRRRRAGGPAGLGGGWAGRAGSWLPVAPGPGRGLPSPRAAVRRRAGSRRRRRHGDDRRLRRARRRRRPRRDRVRRGHRPAPRRVHDPRAARGRRCRARGRPAAASSSAAATTIALLATFPDVGSVPAGWLVVGEVRAGEGVTVDGEEYDGPTGWTHF